MKTPLAGNAAVSNRLLQRHYEALCRIRCPQLPLRRSGNTWSLDRAEIPKIGGVYAFWWTGNRNILRQRLPCALRVSGPHGRKVDLEFTEEWLGLAADLPVPLYVGKTADDMGQRIAQHLRLGTAEPMKPGPAGKKAPRPTTSCQLRWGIDHVFHDEPDTREVLERFVGLSWTTLDGNAGAALRFYLNDFAVGLMQPPFNIDVER